LLLSRRETQIAHPEKATANNRMTRVSISFSAAQNGTTQKEYHTGGEQLDDLQ
jgi:hypothetical protein